MVRNPAVAGQFYPKEREVLSLEIEGFADRIKAKKEDATGLILPHAGYMYSGSVTGAVLASVNPKPTYIIMGPNHTGLGSLFSISASDSWRTPLGEAKIDGELTERILKDCHLIRKDELTHIYEHSIEVQLPFLQKLYGDFTFVPMTIGVCDINTYRQIGECLAKSVKVLNRNRQVVIIASSDMTHYESQESAKEKDFKAIEAILKLDEKALVERVEEFDITMCGFAPTAIMLTAVKKLGAKNARLVKYQTSGDISHDRSSVVGYAGIIVN